MELSSQLIKGEVREDEETLEKYSRDASLFKIKPRTVVFPEDTEDIERLVAFVKGHEGLSLTVRS
ncbi:MAG TPA: FAD-binding oxidoreductase, partial [candidate division CPR3 bacterium]|nr:FAD-binding oxidoreductase [candidate division CPR3 bacterium]